MGQLGFLRLQGILQQGAGSLQGDLEVITAEGRQVLGIEMPAEGAGGIFHIELPHRSLAQGRMIDGGGDFPQLFIEQYLRRFDAFDLGTQRFQPDDFTEYEAATADIHEGKTVDLLGDVGTHTGTATGRYCQQAVVPPCI